jgi:DAK2 domain fusion protein YloV
LLLQKEIIVSKDNKKTIDGELFKKMLLGGVANLQANVQEVNDLNVFPIPDGDTGENMYLTLHGGYDELVATDTTNVSEEASAMAKGMLLGARGNSGVILSQLFFGLAEGVKGLESITLREFADALNEGVKRAYGSVQKPVEGTILTVARESSEKARASLTDDTTIEAFFDVFIKEMKISLENTPELLPVLKESGVIDSGGAGLVYICEGFLKGICGDDLSVNISSNGSQAKSVDLSKFNENSVMEFGYCTEFLLQLQTSKVDVNAFDPDQIVKYLETIGDSIVAFKTGTIVKIHVHTLTPHLVLGYCQHFGEFLTIKIENMTLQHSEVSEKKKETIKRPKRARRKFATVTVSTGDGLKAVFTELGADYVIFGGQTNNPSAEDFVTAFDEVNADYVFVLPNNGNVILAAKQAAEIYKDSQIRVIPSKTIGQGYSALSMLDYSADDPDEIEQSLIENMQGTETGLVAKSVRTTSLNGVEVIKDNYMGFTDKTMLVCQPDKVDTAIALIDKLNAGEKEFLIAVYGKDSTDDERSNFIQKAKDKYPDVEIYEIEGGQDVYDFMFIIE